MRPEPKLALALILILTQGYPSLMPGETFLTLILILALTLILIYA